MFQPRIFLLEALSGATDQARTRLGVTSRPPLVTRPLMPPVRAPRLPQTSGRRSWTPAAAGGQRPAQRHPVAGLVGPELDARVARVLLLRVDLDVDVGRVGRDAREGPGHGPARPRPAGRREGRVDDLVGAVGAPA